MPWSYLITKTKKTEAVPEALAKYLGPQRACLRPLQELRLHHVATPDPQKKIGNMRMFEPAVLAPAQVEKLDGAEDC